MTAPTAPSLSRAMVLAAGLGTRMRALSEEVPKPLIQVAGRALLDHVIERIAAAGIDTVVVNTHHMADALESHLGKRDHPHILISREATLLETGGGVAAALGWLGATPFLVANCDGLWLDGPTNTLVRLARSWDEDRMDALLLVYASVRAQWGDDCGDFFIAPGGEMRRRSEGEIAPFIFTGVQILHPRLFDGHPEGAFSLNLLYDRAEAEGRLFGLPHDGEWLHLGTPEAIPLAERLWGPVLRATARQERRD